MEGQATNQLEVSVVAKPPMCQDRLLVSNITSSSCRLTWQPPKDDGGLPLRYIIEKYTSSGDSWTVHVRTLTQCGNYGNLLSRFFDKKGKQRATFLLKKLLRWFCEMFFFGRSEFCIFQHCVWPFMQTSSIITVTKGLKTKLFLYLFFLKLSLNNFFVREISKYLRYWCSDIYNAKKISLNHIKTFITMFNVTKNHVFITFYLTFSNLATFVTSR